jgi:NADH-quinone oxidoreductase subunit J
MILTFSDAMLLLLLILIILLSFLAVEKPNIMYALLFLFGLNVALGILYFVLGAPLVGVVQLAVFSGAIVVLFLLAAMLTKGGKWK